MLFDWITLGIFAVCVIVCAVIIWRKLPALASIRIDAIPKHQQAAQKQALLDKRLQTKLGNFEARIVRGVEMVFGQAFKFFKNLILRLKRMESEYRRKVITQQALDNPDVLRAKIVATLNQAQTALNQGDLAQAEQFFVDVVSMDAKNLDAYIGMADIAIAKKDYGNAREALNYVLKVQKDSEAAYLRLGRIATDEGKLTEAEADFLTTVSLNATTASAHFELAGIEEKLGNLEKAEKAFGEAIKLEPANPKYLDGLLQFAIRQKNKTLAKKSLAKLSKANPENQKLAELSKEIENLG
ncbi:tetratricopeptide repeat protein [Candidatus Parcubacteria bacterium]|nr:MAG: tetratricopeptide repeat protein [Candidatus Parcubacteria bacterium]